MVFKEGKQYVLFILAGTAIFAHVAVEDISLPMSFEEKEELKEEAKDMFYHAFRAYMENAYPADELMPLSCKGRWKDPLNSRGDLDDTLGNFSLTLVDSLDTLVILGDLDEFESAVKLVVKDVSFDHDVVVSVFETNIRVLGGLLSAHILAEYFQQRHGIMPWYRAELLTMAKDLGFRLLPAFNTTTGIPHSKVNLRHGLKNMRLSAHQETCTACAGTMILEMAALSRLTGEPIFEQKAHRAMDGLWRIRHRSSDLMGTVLNVQSGDWVRRDSGVGAGIDSYYEYCLKAYILLGDEKYLGRFNKHYRAIMKYISQGPMLVDVHMHRPHTNSKYFMDALLAFWPGLQVLKGDIKPAVETHEMLYQIMQRHNLIPEAFTTDFHVHWGQHPLRPEFVESTYFLYKATNDPYYLEVGKSALKSLQKFARVPCGYATVKDVRTGGHDDRMDSFVLAETFKYLYLLFADPNDLLLDLDEFLFTTEAHLLPLSLSRNHNLTSFVLNEPHTEDLEGLNSEFARVCPNTLDLFPETVRKPLKNLVNGMCPRTIKRNLLASQFTAGNSEHLQILKNMGIAVLSMADGRVQLVHTLASARSQADGNEGFLFMQEMLELSQSQKHMRDHTPMSVIFERNGQMFSVAAGPGNFGKELSHGMKVTAKVGVADPIRACDTLVNNDRLKGRIVIIERGDCMFVNKVRKVEEAGAVAAIVIDNTPGTSSMTSSMFAMSGDGKNDVSIPAVFLFHEDASELLKAIEENLGIEITITDANNTDAGKHTLDIAAVVEEMNSKKIADKSGIKADFQATIERLLSGKEIIKVAHREPRLDKPNHNHFADSKLQQLLNSHQGTGEGEIPEWLLKLYEKLQLREHQLKVESGDTERKVQNSAVWLLQHLMDESINADEKKEVHRPPEYKNNDINESDSRKVADEVMQLIDNSLKLKFDSESKLVKPLKVHILQEKLFETFVKLKSLLMEKPKNWDEMYVIHISMVKTIINKLEEFLKEVESAVFNEPVYDLKTKATAMFALDVKENLESFKQTIKHWDYLAKIILEKREPLPKNDDIILVEHKKGAVVEGPKGKDEL